MLLFAGDALCAGGGGVCAVGFSCEWRSCRSHMCSLDLDWLFGWMGRHCADTSTKENLCQSNLLPRQEDPLYPFD